MTQTTDISVIIVNYNVKDFLLQCLRSIEQAKKNLNLEVIVVDNNSSDGSVDYLKPMFPAVSFVSLDVNYGFAKANNIGIKQAIGKYVLILNPDTIIEENTLHIMYKYMEENAKVGIAGCKVLNPDGTFQVSCRRGFPTPWASFSKLFGLQTLFPKSKLFAKYNQTFRNIDETYFIDAIMGAFMFARRDVLEQINGFDESFFMYGEDIDICYRTKKLGYEIAYFHETSIIHYKGESTRRSSINDVKHFYNAMEIFAKKHYSSSFIFLTFLRLGIFLRTFLAYFFKHKKEILIIIFDLFAINFSMLIGTYWRWGDYFHLPYYAYPTVFIVMSIVLFISMVAIGEYFEGKPSVRKSFFGLMISFFVLSSLTYFFKEYAFSRGVLLMTIGFTLVLSSLLRIIISSVEKLMGKEKDKRIAIVGTNKHAETLITSLQSVEIRNVVLTGIISTRNVPSDKVYNLPVLGNIGYLSRIIEQNKLDEIIITDETITKNELMKIIAGISNPSIRFHAAQEFDEVLTSRIIDEISGIEPTIPKLNISKFRLKVVKRLVDIFSSFFILTIGLPVIYLLAKEKTKTLKNFWQVLIGKKSIVGQYRLGEENNLIGKEGIIGLAHISKPELLTNNAIINLNNYYLQNYSLALDLDIFVKFIFRKKSGI